MIDPETQLKVQAFVDGELSQAETKTIANLLARDPDAAALANELKFTRQALVGFEKERRLPESREFYWSKIQRQIAAGQPVHPTTPTIPWMARLRRLLAPAAAVAVVAIAGFIAMRPATAPNGAETSLSAPGAFTYRDFASGTTLVWLSYPAEDTLGGEN